MVNNAQKAGMKSCTNLKIIDLNVASVFTDIVTVALKKILNFFITSAWKFQRIKPLKIWDGVTTRSGIII